MAKNQTQFICSSCGAVFSRWQGKCSQCGGWNTLSEAVFKSTKRASHFDPASVGSLGKVEKARSERIKTGMGEFDRVLGGGIIPDSVVLLGGDPGIGKSTLIIQVASKVASTENVIYVSGEESKEQVALRAERLGINSSKLLFMAENDLETILEGLKSIKPKLAIIDSIQTVSSGEIAGVAGNVSQVTYSSQRLIELAKTEGIALVIIGHVTKEGNFAGPKILEHLVDVVLYLEGDRYSGFRVVRGVKNRFGSTNETGIFEMTAGGLLSVANPSEMLLSERSSEASGTTIFPAMEGRRCLLTEVQALTTTTPFGYPRRTASGIDLNRLQLLIAILSKRAGLNLSTQDVFVNIVGGLTIREPGIDLPTMIAVVSALKNRVVDSKTVIFGEVGLAGEVRNVNNIEERLAEAEKLGFLRAVVPKLRRFPKSRLKVVEVRSISEAISHVLK